MAEKRTKFHVAIGFNIPDPERPGEELRYEPNADEPVIVHQKDFNKSVWSHLIAARAIAPADQSKAEA